MKIAVSGGHLTPALALVDFALKKNDEVVFIGREFSKMSLEQKSHEAEEVGQRGVKFIPFHTGKLGTGSPLEMLGQMSAFLQSISTAAKILKEEKPDVFVSFGGYLALPIAIAAWRQNIPVVTHEQTRTAGVANRWIAKFAKTVAVSFPETLPLFPKGKTVLTGNPVRQNVFDQKPKQPTWISQLPTKPILYITGGSQGSQIINLTVAEAIGKILDNWCVIHQCGNPTSAMNYKEVLETKKAELPKEFQSRYFISEWLSEEDQAWVYQHAEAVLSRSGANTIQELLLMGRPAILIPLPNTHEDEQLKNAQAMVKAGSGMILEQKNLTPETLLSTLADFKKNLEHLQKNAERYQKEVSVTNADADKKLYEVVKKVVGK